MSREEYEHELEMAELTVRNEGSAHALLRNGKLIAATGILVTCIRLHHRNVKLMDRQRITLETLSYWQRTFDNPDCDE